MNLTKDGPLYFIMVTISSVLFILQRTFGLSHLNLGGDGCHHTPHREIWNAVLEAGLNLEGWYLVRSEAALLLLLLLDSESELLRGRLQSLRYTKKLFFTGWFPPLKPLAGKSWLGVGQEGRNQSVRCRSEIYQGKRDSEFGFPFCAGKFPQPWPAEPALCSVHHCWPQPCTTPCTSLGSY